MRRIDEYWASFFGLSTADFIKEGLKVVPHAELHDYQGAWLFRRGASTIISVPPGWVEKIEMHVRRRSQDTLTDRDFIALFGEGVEKVIGPAYQGYLQEADFRPVASSARLLSAADDTALQELAAACDAGEWDHSGIQVGQHPNFGVFSGDCLVATANYVVQKDTAAWPGIITHPGYRGRGCGKAVLSAAVEHGLSKGLLLLYQTLAANGASIAVAENLGYRQYAAHLAVRLR